MKIIYECRDGGQDGSDRNVIGYCTDPVLAKQVTTGRETFGNGDGEIQEIQVWESLDDVPADERKIIAEQTEKKSAHIKEEAEECAVRLIALLKNAPKEVQRRIFLQMRIVAKVREDSVGSAKK